MDILVALGDIYGASKLVDITSAQVSGVSYKTIGDAGLEYLEDLEQGNEPLLYNESLGMPFLSYYNNERQYNSFGR